jgi:acetyl-CoA carboxylase biotin carboxyl carrier protein
MMRPDDLTEVAAAMTLAGVGRLELKGPDFHLVLACGAGDAPVATEVALAQPDAEIVPVAAPGLGTFLRTHPLHDRPLAGDGEAVAAGQAIALLQIGALLTPVPAPANGLIVGALPEDGALVGYGDRLFDFLPQE